MEQRTTVWMGTPELCAHLGIERTTLWRWRKEGLPVHRPGGRPIFDLAEVEEWVRSRCVSEKPGRPKVAA